METEGRKIVKQEEREREREKERERERERKRERAGEREKERERKGLYCSILYCIVFSTMWPIYIG